MLQSLIKFFKHSATTGTYLLAAHDVDKGKASFTLFAAYASNLLALSAIIYLLTQDPKSGTVSAIVYSVITMVLYLMRRIQSFKVDADDGELELSAGSEGVGPGENNESK